MKRLAKRGFTLVEIMIVVAIIALLAAIAIPNVLRGRTTANESAAIGNLRALVSSLEMYRSVNNLYPNPVANWQSQVYTPVPAFGPPSFNVPMTGGNPASRIQGYLYTYASAGATYTISSVMEVLNSTGTRSFFVDESGVIRHELGSSGAGVGCATIDQPPSAAASC